jgi:GTP diphosphokinase / guanosine-3',5'-bis(diphosphate) 3'-diphosphatase
VGLAVVDLAGRQCHDSSTLLMELPTALPVVATVLRALEFAAARHAQQRRKGPSAEPYVNHLIEVASLLASHGHGDDANLLAAAVLHDVLEDTATSEDELRAAFGDRVCALVEEVTDDKTLALAERRDQILEHLKTAEPTVKLIKLADLSSNVASIPSSWTRQRAKEYLDWTSRAARLCRDASPALYGEFERRAARSRRTGGAGAGG